jgi:hypothetical protein
MKHVTQMDLNDNIISTVPQRIAFVHVPKTGGTTLSRILQEHYEGQSYIVNVTWKSERQTFEQMQSSDAPLITGHFPQSLINLDEYDTRLTIIRSPLTIASSLINFTENLGYGNGRVSSALSTSTEMEIYQEYFCTNVDMQRFFIESYYGFAKGFINCVNPCSADEAIDNLKKFNWVLDFDNLDRSIKKFIINAGFFPYSIIGNARQNLYKPDIERASHIVSQFDNNFYAKATSHFLSPGNDIDTCYLRYRKAYAAQNGLKLKEFEECQVSLKKPIGTGWHTVEYSEKGIPFRWSDNHTPTIDLPFRQPGKYLVRVYLQEARASIRRTTCSTIANDREIDATRNKQIDPIIYEFQFSLDEHDWLTMIFYLEDNNQCDVEKEANGELRDIGVILGTVYVKRLPDES